MSYSKIRNESFGQLCYYKDKNHKIIHREDGPAIIYPNGTKIWFQNGKHHRVDGPAVEWYDGGQIWYQYGKLHRLDGPASTTLGEDYYAINGRDVWQREFPTAVAKYVSYIEVTTEDIKRSIGKYRIVEW